MPRILANASSTRSRSSDVFFVPQHHQQNWNRKKFGLGTFNDDDENENENDNDDDETEDAIRLTFKDLALPEHVVLGLQKCGFIYPSPVQVSAIPLERLGRDVLVQAKSGTGKTVAFACRLLDSVLLTKIEAEAPEEKREGEENDNDNFAIDERRRGRLDASSSVKAMCIAPTREIALQTADVLRTLATACAGSAKGLYKQERLACFFGGLPVADDGRVMKRRPACVVGTPGRMKQLVEMDILRTDQIRTVVLDEADQLLTQVGFCQDVLFLIHAASHRQRQLIACSATFSKTARKRMESLTTRDGKPSAIEKVSLCEETVALKGVKMCYRLLFRREEKMEDLKEKESDNNDDDDDDDMYLLEEKAEACIDIFNSVRFHQAVIFVESRDRGEKLSAIMTRKGGFKTAFTSGKLPQRERMNVMQRFRDFELRAIVSTDLISRGVDCERVNLVVNVDLPRDGQTFMHRCGRTGRFGTSGVAVAVLKDEKELKTLKDMLDKTSEEESERKIIEDNDENDGEDDENQNRKKDTRVAFCNLEELPDTVPESWYAYDLEENDEKRLQALQLEEEKLALLETSSEEEEEEEEEESRSYSGSSSNNSSSGSSSSSSDGGDSEGEYDDDEDFEEIERRWREKRAYASWWWWHKYRQKIGDAFVVPPF